MNWSDLGKKIAGLGLPLLANAVLPGSGAAVAAIEEALGLHTGSSPDAISKAIDADPEAAIKLAQIQADKEVELARLVAQQNIAALDSEDKQQAQINESMRAEIASPHGVRAGWRPLYGYIMAVSTGAIFLALVHAMWVQPDKAVDLMKAAADLIVVSLTVLGVNIHKRSQDKQAAMGGRPLGLFESIAQWRASK